MSVHDNCKLVESTGATCTEQNFLSVSTALFWKVITERCGPARYER